MKMILTTKHFGNIDIDETKLLTFEKGILGFENLTQFALLHDEALSPEEESVFYWLQSVEDESIAFVLVNMVSLLPDYNPIVAKSEIDALGEYNEDTFTFYNIATIPENIKDMTVNLKAPIVINSKNRLGKQVICTNEEYTIRHYMFKE